MAFSIFADFSTCSAVSSLNFIVNNNLVLIYKYKYTGNLNYFFQMHVFIRLSKNSCLFDWYTKDLALQTNKYMQRTPHL
jgi:hypothetical protein